MTFDQETLYKINMFAVLEDVQERLLLEIQPDMRHALKAMSKEARVHSHRLIKEFDRIHSNKNAIGFGVAADEVYDILEKNYNPK